MSKFEPAFIKAMLWEGGKADIPGDPGGRTYKGITQRAWDAFCKTWNQPTKDVWDLKDEEVHSFYLVEHWIPLRGKLIKSQSFANVLFSMAILQGRKTVVRRMQTVLGLRSDGVFGPKTLAAVEAANPVDLILKFRAANVDFFERLAARRPTSEKFLQGWKNRVNSYEAVA